MKLEIERKFLLKSLPNIRESEIIKIDQFYKRSGELWERVRLCESNVSGISYVHTIKKNISKGVNIEDEYLITESQFYDFKKSCELGEEYRYISKERWIYPYDEDPNLKWEIDKFNDGYHIIIAEIEIPKKSYDLKIPSFLEDLILLEVTGLKQFSNRNLSKIIKNEL